jgi:hypothetical protein
MNANPRATQPSEAAPSAAPPAAPSAVFSEEEARALRRLLDELELDFERDLVPLAVGPNRDDSSALGRGASSPLNR